MWHPMMILCLITFGNSIRNLHSFGLQNWWLLVKWESKAQELKSAQELRTGEDNDTCQEEGVMLHTLSQQWLNLLNLHFITLFKNIWVRAFNCHIENWICSTHINVLLISFFILSKIIHTLCLVYFIFFMFLMLDNKDWKPDEWGKCHDLRSAKHFEGKTMVLHGTLK